MTQDKYAGKRARNPRYYTAAEAAAVKERNGQYVQAEKLWLRAKKLAKHPNNMEWAVNRSHYCMRALHNEWSYIN